MKIGLNLISTGKYDVFVKPLVNSIDRYFFKNNIVNIYLFTDKPIFVKASERIKIVQSRVEHKPFPNSTLMRYQYFSDNAGIYDCSHLYYCDVDMLFVGNVGEEILSDPLKDGGLMGVIHPGFFKGGGSWSNDFNSLAYVPIENRKRYYAGGFQGGEVNAYLSACEIMKNNIIDDSIRGVMAEWHDESHWNKFLSTRKVKELNPSYCYPESWKLPFPKLLLALDKDHSVIRS